jgi:hypothetical protein
MAESLTIAGQIELLGPDGGMPSQVPQCAGATFLLAPGYDLSAPQTVVDILAAGLLDGEVPIGRRASNRTITLPIKLTAPDRTTLAAAREFLLSTIDEDYWQLVWTRDGGLPMVLDCFRAAPAVAQSDVLTEQQLVSLIQVSFQALPYGRSDQPEVLEFPAPSQTFNQPASPVSVDIFGTASNFLQGDDAGFEATVGNWLAAVNCAVARTTAQAHSGTASLGITSSAAGNMEAISCSAGAFGTLMFAVSPGRTYTLSGWFRAATAGRSCNVGLDFYDPQGVQVGARLAGSNITDTTTGFTQATASIVAPATAAWARVHPQVVSTAAGGELHYLDDVSLDGGAVYSYTDSNQWLLSSLTPVTGHHSAKWIQTAQDYPVYDHILPAAIDITNRGKWTFWLGLGTSTPTVWTKGTVTFAVTLTDNTGAQISFSGRQQCTASKIDSQPHWQLISVPIAQAQSGFDYTHVARYSIAAWNLWNAALVPGGLTTIGQPVLQSGAYLAEVIAAATATGSALTRGFFGTMPGIVGSARAPLAIQATPGVGSFSTVSEFTTPGSNAFTTPVGLTVVDKSEVWSGGGGGAGRSSNVGNPGGGGGGGTEYAAETAIPVNASTSYPPFVGSGGAGGAAGSQGASGTDSHWAGQSGPTVYANGGRGGWQSSTWGGGKGGTGSSNRIHFPGGNGHQSNANGDGFGGGGGSSGGSASGGNPGDGDSYRGAAAPTGGGPGGDGGRSSGSPKNGSSPSIGPGGGGGGGSQQSGSTGAAGANGKVRLTYGATGILPLASLLCHVPGRDEPPAFQPLCPIPTSDVPNGGTEYTVPVVQNLNARYNGTYTIYLVASTYNTPSSPRTVTIQFRQYPFSAGTAQTQNLVRTFTPSADVVNGYTDMGAITLPIADLPAGNLSAIFAFTITSTNTSDRFQDLIILSAAGSTVLVNVPGSSIFNNLWVDPPDTNRAVGLVLGSDADRDRAFSAAQYIERYSGGPLSVEPGTHSRLLVYAAQGLPGFTASYVPHWWMDRAQ